MRKNFYQIFATNHLTDCRDQRYMVPTSEFDARENPMGREDKIHPSNVLLAASTLASTSTLTQNARSFWLSSRAVRDLIHDGRLERADQILRNMTASGTWLLEGPQSGRALGRQMLRTVSELSLKYIAERIKMATDLIGSMPESGK